MESESSNTRLTMRMKLEGNERKLLSSNLLIANLADNENDLTAKYRKSQPRECKPRHPIRIRHPRNRKIRHPFES